MVLDSSVEKCLPTPVIDIIRNYNTVNEIRMRKNCPLALTVGNKNLICNYVTTRSDIEYSLSRFCKNSVYSYFDFINQGYIPFDNGYRIGVCGNAVLEKNNVINISEVKSLNIRIPCEEINIPTAFLKNLPYEKSLLVFSGPNIGKTTFLKNAAALLASPPFNKRVTVIDCKNEIHSNSIHHACPIDFFTNYPKYTAIDLAIRNMSPQILICDEIGLNDEIAPLIECRNSGVALICSAHASTTEELFRRENIKKLHKANVFGGYIGITQIDNTRHYSYINREDIKC